MTDLVTQARETRVLTLWHVEQKSTWCIAHDLKIPEEEVCWIIENAEGRAEKLSVRRNFEVAS